MLDSFAGNVRRSAVWRRFTEWRAAGAELEELERSEQEKLRLLDLWKFQRKEIESAAPEPGEDAALDAERRVLQNLGRLQENAGTAYASLYDSPNPPWCRCGRPSSGWTSCAGSTRAWAPFGRTCRRRTWRLQEASFGLRDYLGAGGESRRLDEIETRLAGLDR